MSFWHNEPALLCLVLIAISVLIAFVLLRPFRPQQLVTRLPLFLVTGGALLFGAVVTLPEASPYVFERILGHSLDAMVTQQLGGGVTMSENWLTFWGESVGTAFRFTIIGSAIWAIVNLIRRKAIWSNVITLTVSLAWACLYVWASIARFPI